jgi:hypothetical protein
MHENREKWIELCTRAADEQDPRNLATLILEINCMLEAKELRLLKAAPLSSFDQDKSTLRSSSQSRC